MMEDKTQAENMEMDAVAADMHEEGDAESRVYELGYLIVPAISEEDAPKEASALKELVVKLAGSVISEDAPHHISLAYTMYRSENGKRQKFDAAHFGGIKFEMEPAQVLELKEALDTNKNILRYIVFKTVRENTRSDVKPPQARSSDRGDRGDRRMESAPKAQLRKEEENVPVSEEALDRSIKELVVE